MKIINSIICILALLLVSSIATAQSWPNFHNGNVLIKNGYVQSSDGFKAGASSKLTIIKQTGADNVVTNSIPANQTSGLVSLTVTDVLVGDTVIATPVAVASGIETTNLMWHGYISAANTVTIRATNPTAGAIDILDTQSWTITILRLE